MLQRFSRCLLLRTGLLSFPALALADVAHRKLLVLLRVPLACACLALTNFLLREELPLVGAGSQWVSTRSGVTCSCFARSRHLNDYALLVYSSANGLLRPFCSTLCYRCWFWIMNVICWFWEIWQAPIIDLRIAVIAVAFGFWVWFLFQPCWSIGFFFSWCGLWYYPSHFEFHFVWWWWSGVSYIYERGGVFSLSSSIAVWFYYFIGGFGYSAWGVPTGDSRLDPDPNTLATPKRSFAQIVTRTNTFPKMDFSIKPPTFMDADEPAVFFSQKKIETSSNLSILYYCQMFLW